MMYRTVLKIERKAARYGVNTLRLHVQKARERAENDSNEDSTPPPNVIGKIRDCKSSCWSFSLGHLLTCCRNSNNADRDSARTGMRRSPRSKKRVSRKKSILHIASGYVMGWALVWVPALMALLLPQGSAIHSIIASLLNPLQGLFNFLVFMSPKVRATKKPRRGAQNGNLSWYGAIIKSYTSRGEKISRA